MADSTVAPTALQSPRGWSIPTERYSGRIAIFDHGELLQIGKPQEVYDRPASRFVAEFLGEINLMPLQGLAVERGAAIGTFEDSRLTVPAPASAAQRSGILAIRPEYLSVGLARPQGACNAVGAAVEAATYLGSITRLKLRTGGANSITVSLPGHAAAPILSAGGQVWISWPSDQGFLLPAGETDGTHQI